MRGIFRGSIAVLLLGVSLTVYADMTMTQVRTAEAIKDGKADGSPKADTSTLWVAADKMRMDGVNESVLLNAGKDSMYLIDNKKKTYMGIDMSVIANGPAKNDAMPAGMPGMFANMMKMEVTIEPTTETKTINKWACTKYLQTMNMMGTTTTSELWATEDVKVDPGIIKKFMASFFLKAQSTKDLAAQIMKEYGKINGFVVYSVSTTGLHANGIRNLMDRRIDDGRRANLCESIALGSIGLGHQLERLLQEYAESRLPTFSVATFLKFSGREYL